jgi:2-keto-3-deoxy-galactonokinase
MKQFTEASLARVYIYNFSVGIMPGTKWVRVESGEFIKFGNMTDEQAIRAANALVLMEVEAAEKRERNKDN